MKISSLSPALKAATVIMAILLAAGTVTSCTGKTGGKRTVNPDVTKQNADGTSDTAGTESGSGTGSEADGDRRYATDYPLDVKEQKSDFFDDWYIWKRQEDGMIFLQISNTGFHERETEIEYLLFWVYDSAEDARKAYEGYYNRSKEYDEGRFWEEGDNWFISKEPDVMDASLVWMNYREGNVIISANLGSTSSWAAAKENDTDSGASDALARKDYILKNAPEIRSYVIDVIMEA